MKNLSWFDKFIFFLNSLFSAALLFAYLLPYIPPNSFALLSVLSLGVPLLIMANIVFLLYWLIRFKKQVLLPLIVLLLGFNHLTSIYEFTTSEDNRSEDDISILSYNVRQFNQFGWDKQEDIPQKIGELIRREDPDIMALQEYYKGELKVAERFPYKYINIKSKNAEFGLALLSKFPIIDSGSLDFPTSSNNNAIFADIVVQQDTMRFINVHLQSFTLKPDLDKVDNDRSKKVFLGMGQTFATQQNQMQMILNFMETSPYKVVLLGDFNNTAYSYIYRKLTSSGLKDAFKEKGHGIGRTFDFDYFPLRIDYIFVNDSIEVTSFKTQEASYSDHFPIKTTISI